MISVGKDQRIKGNEKERQVEEAVPPENIGEDDKGVNHHVVGSVGQLPEIH